MHLGRPCSRLLEFSSVEKQLTAEDKMRGGWGAVALQKESSRLSDMADLFSVHAVNGRRSGSGETM